MTPAIIVAGTGTNVGKTVFAAALAGALQAAYWKPVQAGLVGETDTEIVGRLAHLAPGAVLPEAYRLTTPASPHISAERDGIEIDVDRLAQLPSAPDGASLIIETAGGLLVPLTSKHLQIDLIARWGAPVVLVATTQLGTINHSLLSVEALKQRGIPLIGIAFVGDENADAERTIVEFAAAPRLGRLPHIHPLDAVSLRAAFAASFNVADFCKPVHA